VSHDHPEIRQWLAQRGYSPKMIDRIMLQIDKFDERINRESLFEDLASGAFDIDSVIKAALADESGQ
jgi:hypothetical protein